MTMPGPGQRFGPAGRFVIGSPVAAILVAMPAALLTAAFRSAERVPSRSLSRSLHSFPPRVGASRQRGVPAALTVLLTLGLAACAPLAPQQGAGTWVPSPNFDQRRPNYVILHQTSNDNTQRALATLTDPRRKVSAHYLIGRDGTVLQLVDENARAWHAGASWWGGSTDLNSASLGIELDNTGDEPFAEAQIVALLALLDELRSRHRIPAANFLAHGDVAPGRKVDPSAFFPWQRLARHGFGLWCDAPPPAAPPGFDPALGLRALGYDPLKPVAARQAFRRHFVAGSSAVPGETGSDTNGTGGEERSGEAAPVGEPERAVDSAGELSPGEQGLLYCLLQQQASSAMRSVPPPSVGKGG
ncbi:hypothetical protein CKO20_13510 [Rhodocyclus tenuis]|nr:hypothetical protein [Rhodocyclus tenuis]